MAERYLRALDIIGGNPSGFPYYTKNLHLETTVYDNGTYVQYALGGLTISSTTSRSLLSTDLTVENTYGGNPMNITDSNFTPISGAGIYSITLKLDLSFSALATGLANFRIVNSSDTMTFGIQTIVPDTATRHYTLNATFFLDSLTSINFIIQNTTTAMMTVLNTSRLFITRVL